MSSRFFADALACAAVLLLIAVVPEVHASGGVFAKKDPCPQPPQAIPESERQRLHAAVGASVEAVNVGAQASGGSDREASYRVVGFTPEGFEGAWLRYEMCMQRANGVITAEQYDKFLASNGLVTSTTSSVATSAPVPSSAPATSSGGPTAMDTAAPALIGAWSVTSTFVSSTCPPPGDTFGVDALDWLVSAGPDGRLRAEVRGSAFARLEGSAGSGRTRLVGVGPVEQLAGFTFTNQTTYALTVDGDGLRGERTVALLLPGGEGVPATTCSVTFAVEGHRR